MAVQTDKVQSFGSLIAVEGDKDVISTQLRLLPPSSKILIMGPLIDTIQQPSNDEDFDPRAYVREIHQKLLGRTEVARSFLEDSTEDQPRLVFMNGGSVNARTSCVTKISERLTNGEIKAAEDIFQEIVDDGVAGLMLDGDKDLHQQLFTPEDWASESVASVEEEHSLGDIEEAQEDPSMVAMKAADSLDRDTAELQAMNEDEVEEIDMQGLSRSRLNSSGDVQRIPQMGDSVFTDENGAVIRTTVITIPTQSASVDDKRDTFGGQEALGLESHHVDMTSRRQSDIDFEAGLLSPMSRRGSEPQTPGLVEIGEACVVDMGSRTVRRVKSVDRFSGRQSAISELDISPRKLRPVASAQNLKSERLADNEGEPYGEPSYSKSLEMLPRTTFVRASQTFIRRTPPVSRQPSCEPVKSVDHGADAENVQSFTMADAGTQCPEDDAGQVLFEPVFPIVEDLIIHFTEDTRNEIREAIIRSYMDGSYPVMPSVLSDSASSASEAPSQLHSGKRSAFRPYSYMTAETDDDGYHRRQEYDPYNSSSYPTGGKPLWRSQETSKKSPHIATQIAEPLTPATTPPPTLSGNAQKFQEFTPLNATTPIAMHNSLRSILNMHFPPETKNYRQHTYPEESNRLWMPVFRNFDGMDGRTVDQIIAIGCEDGVKKDLYNDIVGQVSKLGTKKSGISRAGRLDIG